MHRAGITLHDGQVYPHSFTPTDLDAAERFIRSHDRVLTCAEFVASDRGAGMICIRHDIDHDLNHALRFAMWEYERGIHSTYFVLPTANYFRSDYTWTRTLALEIQSLGHEVGIHNDALVACGGDVDAALMLLRKWAAEFRGWGIDLHGVADHGGSVHDNTDIWRVHGHAPSEVGFDYEAYLMMREQPTNYISDNQGTWRAALEKDERPTVMLMHPCHWQLPVSSDA